MKKHLITVALAAGILTATGCTSFNASQPSAALNTTIENGLKADIAVGGDITGQSSINILFGFIKLGGDTKFADGVNYGSSSASTGILSFLDPVEAVKSAAAFKAVTDSQADVIVAPRYEVSVNDFFVFKTVDVTVKGKKGTIRSIR